MLVLRFFCDLRRNQHQCGMDLAAYFTWARAGKSPLLEETAG